MITKLKKSSIDTRKTITDKTSKIITSTLAWLFSLVFIALIGFIIYASVPGFQFYGFINILFSGKFDLSKNQASIWLPMAITLLTTFIAIIIAGPLGIKSSVFIKYRIPQKYQKPLRIAIELLADIPSVIFGLFAIQALGTITGSIFGVGKSFSILTASFMLSFMILPTIVSLTLNALDGVSNDLLTSAMVLGNTKTKAIYRICKKECRNGITVGIIMAISRAIGETMAVSMILQSQMYNNTFDGGFSEILISGLRTLGALISANMFAESGGPALQGLLFAFGIVMFIIVLVLNAIAMRITKKKGASKNARVRNTIAGFVLFLPNKIKILWEKITYHSKISKSNVSEYVGTRVSKNKAIHLYDYWKLFWEWFSIILTLVFLAWILENILVLGGVGVASKYSSVVSFVKDTTGQAFVNTLLIILIAIGIGFPLSLLIAIYLSEFAKEGRLKKTLLFFIDSLGATPSILFGMFGLIFFIQTLGLTSQGAAGKSLIAGVFTILIVILPTFIRTIQQSLQSVPQELRINSYALGAGRWETVRKIVLPMAAQGVRTSIVLSIGRILAETAPLYLTSGLASSSSISLISEGQTLTTRIYAQIYETDMTKASSIMYECAFITIILVLAIILIVHILIPWYYRYKVKREKDRYDSMKRINAKNEKNQKNEKFPQDLKQNKNRKKFLLFNNYFKNIFKPKSQFLFFRNRC